MSMLFTHSLSHSLTHFRLVKLIEVTLACEDAWSKHVEVVIVADVRFSREADVWLRF